MKRKIFIFLFFVVLPALIIMATSVTFLPSGGLDITGGIWVEYSGETKYYSEWYQEDIFYLKYGLMIAAQAVAAVLTLIWKLIDGKRGGNGTGAGALFWASVEACLITAMLVACRVWVNENYYLETFFFSDGQFVQPLVFFTWPVCAVLISGAVFMKQRNSKRQLRFARALYTLLICLLTVAGTAIAIMEGGEDKLLSLLAFVPDAALIISRVILGQAWKRCLNPGPTPEEARRIAQREEEERRRAELARRQAEEEERRRAEEEARRKEAEERRIRSQVEAELRKEYETKYKDYIDKRAVEAIMYPTLMNIPPVRNGRAEK